MDKTQCPELDCVGELYFDGIIFENGIEYKVYKCDGEHCDYIRKIEVKKTS